MVARIIDTRLGQRRALCGLGIQLGFVHLMFVTRGFGIAQSLKPPVLDLLDI